MHTLPDHLLVLDSRAALSNSYPYYTIDYNAIGMAIMPWLMAMHRCQAKGSWYHSNFYIIRMKYMTMRFITTEIYKFLL